MPGLIAAFSIAIWIYTARRKGGSSVHPGQFPRFTPFLAFLARLYLFVFWLALTTIVDRSTSVVTAPIILWLCMPVFLIERVVARVASPRVVYWLRRCSTLFEAATATGPSVLQATVVAARRRDREGLDWVATKLSRLRHPRGTAVVAAGLQAAMRGDHDRARCLMRLADGLPPHIVADGGRALARDWLVVDAMRKGNWREVARLGRRGLRSLRWSYAAARMAERLAGAPTAPGDMMLRFLWMAAPRRRATRPLLRLALRRARGDGEPSDGNLAHLVASERWDDARLAEAAAELDARLECAATSALVAERLVALGSPHPPASVLARAAERLSDLILPLVEVSPAVGAQAVRGPILDAAVARVRARLLRDVEARCAELSRRSTDRLPDAIAEWETWAVLRDRADTLLVLSPETKRTLFVTMYVPVNNFAVFQQNVGKRGALAHNMYAWLLAQCEDNPDAYRLLRDNVRGVSP